MRTVLITGGSRGIGRAMVETFSKEGYKVAFTYKNSENEAKSLAESTGSLAIRADSAVEADVLSAVDTARGFLGDIDCLINNAGISSFSLFTDLTLADWENCLRVNLTGAFLYSKAVIPSMVSRKKGTIINISSMWGLVGSSCEVHYSTAKAALIGMTILLAMEERQSRAYRELYVGSKVSVLFEEEKEILGESYQIGHTSQYVKVAYKTDKNLSNQIVSGRVTSLLTNDILLMED